MKRIPLAIVFLLAPTTLMAQQDGWVGQFFLGSAINAASPLTIRQNGYPDLNLTAHYTERPFYDAPYYSYRVGKWKGGRAWEIQEVHHKLYLNNPPPEVQNFNVSHGYNLITLNRAWEQGGVIYRLGAGIVLTHPESTVRGQAFPNATGGPFNTGNFYLSGVTVQAGVEKRFVFRKHWFFSIEAMATASYARSVPIANGSADIPNMAVHGLFGIGRTW